MNQKEAQKLKKAIHGLSLSSKEISEICEAVSSDITPKRAATLFKNAVGMAGYPTGKLTANANRYVVCAYLMGFETGLKAADINRREAAAKCYSLIEKLTAE